MPPPKQTVSNKRHSMLFNIQKQLLQTWVALIFMLPFSCFMGTRNEDISIAIYSIKKKAVFYFP